MIKLRVSEILVEKGISKTRFAEMMGVQKQNVNLLLNTNNIQKLEQIADALGVEFEDLIVNNKPVEESVNGFVEYRGEVFRIKSKADLKELLKKIKKALIEHRNHICDFGMESLKRHLIVMMVNTMMIEMYRIAFHVISSIEVFQSL